MALEQLNRSLDFVQDTTPSTPNDGDVWLDTSLSPPVVKVYDESVDSFVQSRGVRNLDAPVSEADASAEVKTHDTRFVREMSRLFFDRSLDALNFSDGLFEIFEDTADISTTSTINKTGPNGQVSVSGPNPFDISGAVTFEASRITSATDPRAGTFNDDGTRFYVADFGGGRVFQRDLSTPFDITTAGASERQATDDKPTDVLFNDTGTEMYVPSREAGFRKFSLDTAFDITTASFGSVILNTQDFKNRGFDFADNGSKLYELGADTKKIYEYDLSTAFDPSTASFTGNNLALEGTQPTGITVSNTGEKIITVDGDSNNQRLLQYNYDITDSSGNTVTVTDSEVGTEVGVSALTDGSLTVKANLDNPNTPENALRDFAVYFD